MATATAPAVTREVLLDRWVGLMINTTPYSPGLEGPHVDNSKLYDKVHDGLERAVYGLIRTDVANDAAQRVVDELWVIVRDEAIRLVDEAGIADSPS